ncbi:MAG TPA: group I intron-associated PD-(D/E)XK endonuclease [Solirubrobacteraceae bacterium]|nr:group I intron-associated PD-(D/E)XK endonuclease [Solirubrobacteraceae bacterium]
MAEPKPKGDLAELMVAADLLRQGHRVAFPYGEDWDADLIVLRGRRLERIQVKHAVARDGVMVLRCRSLSPSRCRAAATTSPRPSSAKVATPSRCG